MRILAGKTGTTNDQKDAWFSGFNGDIVTTAWVGFDNSTSLGRRETGGRAALPMWIDYMREALKDQRGSFRVPRNQLDDSPLYEGQIQSCTSSMTKIARKKRARTSHWCTDSKCTLL